jgi:predicted ATPase/class 3 adenylate cyclase/Tfp pilus assembly protein PilF
MEIQPSHPTGTITFLFTDIENSSVMWDQNQASMRAAMLRHDALIESIVKKFRGVNVRPRGEGDSRFAVFSKASDATAAAVDIQRNFSREPWTTASPLRVRIGMNTGEADLWEEDYYGPVVNRAARVRNCAHGGQTLLTQATYHLVNKSLPEGVTLKDLGKYQLGNLQSPEHIYQLVIPGLQTDFPPLRAELLGRRTNLPPLMTSFIGRDQDILYITNLIFSNRLVTITGMGGAGKTRLALQIGHELKDRFSDGIWWVDLAPITVPDLAVKTVADVFDIRPNEGQSLLQTLQDVLRPKESLLILDNCEHLLQETGRIAAALALNAPRLHILSTSREPLGVSGETVWTIPPLTYPNEKQWQESWQEPEDLLDFDSVKLFVDRAVAARPSFLLNSNNAQAVASISKKLEGNPLAIELASARVKVLSVVDLAERLERRLNVLVGNKRTSHPRQHTLEALIDWSYNLLIEKEQALLRRLGIFQGGWMMEAAEEICSGGEVADWEILDLLSSLIDKSLVVPELVGSHQRYRFLEMIRQYALDRLSESGEYEQIAEKHYVYYSKMAEKASRGLWEAEQKQWLSCLQMEHDNLRSALGWTKEKNERAGKMLFLSTYLWRFWQVQGHTQEGLEVLELALQRDTSSTAQLKANGLRGAGNLARQLGDYARSNLFHEQSLALFEQVQDKLGIARQLVELGEIKWTTGDPHAAVDYLTQSLSLHYEIANLEGIATSLEHLGVLARDHGNFQYARDVLEESLEKYRELGNDLLTASAVNNLGMVALHQCKYREAIKLFNEALDLYRRMDVRWGISETMMNLGVAAKDQGDLNLANSMFNESLAIKHDLGDKYGIARCILGHAEVGFFQGSYQLAVELGERSYKIFRERGLKRGMVISLMVVAAAKIYQDDIDTARNLAQEGLELSSGIDTPRMTAYNKVVFGLSEFHLGNLEAAAAFLYEALDIFRRMDDGRSVAQTLVNLARTAYRRGDRAAAQKYLDESLALSRELDIRWSLAFTLEIMGLLKRSEGDYQAALSLFIESLDLAVEQSNQQGIANCLGAIAGLAVMAGQLVYATRLFAAAARLRETLGIKMGAGDRTEYEQYLAALHENMDEQLLAEAMQEGDAFTIPEAVGQAKTLLKTLKQAPSLQMSNLS